MIQIGPYLRGLMQELSEQEAESAETPRQTRKDASGEPVADFARGEQGADQNHSAALEIASSDDHDNTPSWKREATAQAPLARVRNGITEGRLKTLGVNNVAKFAHCGSDRAEWIRSELVREGQSKRCLKVSAAA